MSLSIFARAAIVAGLLASTTSAVFVPGSNKNNIVYWGQTGEAAGNIKLSEVCSDPTVDVVNVAAIVEFPKEVGDYPTMNLGNACWAEYFPDPHDPTKNSPLIRTCPGVPDAIKACKAAGKTVMLTLGGEKGDYYFTSQVVAEYTAEFLIGAYGPKTDAWNGPRPLDDAAIDGFDLDLEATEIYEYYSDFINHVKRLQPKFLISGSPQCIVHDGLYEHIIPNAPFDWLSIQFYNTDLCSARRGYMEMNDTTTGFTFDQWVAQVQSITSYPVKIAMGLPAGTGGVLPPHANDYLSPEEANALASKYQKMYPEVFGGIMLWDASVSARNLVRRQPYSYWTRAILDGDFYDKYNPSRSSSSSRMSSSTQVSSSRTSSSVASSTPASSYVPSSTRASSSIASSTRASSSIESSVRASSSAASSSAASSYVASSSVASSVHASSSAASSTLASSYVASSSIASSVHASSSAANSSPASSYVVSSSVASSVRASSSIASSTGASSVASSVRASSSAASSAATYSSRASSSNVRASSSSTPCISSAQATSLTSTKKAGISYSMSEASTATISSSSLVLKSSSAPYPISNTFSTTTGAGYSVTYGASSQAAVSTPYSIAQSQSSIKVQAYTSYPVNGNSNSPSVTSTPGSGYATSPYSATTTTVTTTYVDVCETGLTTKTAYITKTICLSCAKHTTTPGCPEGWTTSVYVDKTTTLTITKPITVTSVPSYPSAPAQPNYPQGGYPVSSAQYSQQSAKSYPAVPAASSTKVITLYQVAVPNTAVPYAPSAASYVPAANAPTAVPYNAKNATTASVPQATSGTSSKPASYTPAQFQGAASRVGTGLTAVFAIVAGFFLL